MTTESYGHNFAFAKHEFPTIYKETVYAERNAYTHPYLSLNRLRVVFEALVNTILGELGVQLTSRSSYKDKLNVLRGKIPESLWKNIEDLRPICNAASHELIVADEENEFAIQSALNGLKTSKDLAIWFFEKVRKESVPDYEFIPPPASNIEEILLYAHHGDAGSAYEVAMWHRKLIFNEPKKSDIHSKMFEYFLNVSFDGRFHPAKYLKAVAQINSSNEKNSIHEGIYILEDLIKEGEVIDVYYQKAIALERLNRSISADVVAMQGVEKGDPYSMNLVAQWAGHERPKIHLSEQERMQLLERSLDIVFNEEAAYYLSMYYKEMGRIDEAINLLEQCIERKNDTRGLFESRLANILLATGRDPEKAYVLYNSYAEKDYWSALNASNDLINLNEFDLALKYFKRSFTSAMDSEVMVHRDKYITVRDKLLNNSSLTESDLLFLTECVN